MRIVIFGAGSLGSALGAILARKHEVVLVGRRPNMAAIRRSGLRVVGDADIRARVGARESVDGVGPPELLVIATKAYDTASAIDACRDLARGETMVMTLQNGLGNLEALRAWKGVRAFGGTTTMGANLLEPGKVRLSGIGRTVVGSDLDVDGAGRIVRAFSACGIPASAKKDIMGEIWAKAVVSACINPLTAVLRIPNGKLVESPAANRMLSEMCSECEAVADAVGVRLPYASMIRRVRGVAKVTRDNRSSMLQDVERGRRTEISQISGAFVSHGLSKSVRTPLNLTMLAMVQALEESRGLQKG